MGYLLLQDWGEQDLIGLALGSDELLHSLVVKVKKELCLNSRSSSQWSGQLLPHSQAEINNLLSPRASTHSPIAVSPLGMNSLNESLFVSEQPKFGFSKFFPYPSIHTSQMNERWSTSQMTSLQDKTSHSLEQQQVLISPGGSFRMPGQHPFLIIKDRSNFVQMPTKWPPPSPSLVDGSPNHLNSLLTWKPCLFYSRGYCKHGSNCRFMHSGERDFSSHVRHMTEDHPEAAGSDDGFTMPGSIDCLEQELKELLHERRTPVSIASLPQLYYEKFGKTLQAEGYLTESQRHGKAGYSLTKLLMRLKGTITLIDRPHGQHAVVLSENAHKFNEYRGDPDDSCAINSSSRQIYLTFPADSTFTEDDVTIHFSAYGPVQDVRIPCQQRRMFGFVTFVHAETVVTILADGNPHYICGARVLVKPYKDKCKIGDRKLSERNQFKQVLPVSCLPVSNLNNSVLNELEESQFVNCLEDETFPALESGIMGLQLSGIHTQVSQATPVASVGSWQQDQLLTLACDMDSAPLSADDDCFDLQSSAIGHVLDILEGESKETDSTEYSLVETDKRLDASITDYSFENPRISETSVNTFDKISTENPSIQQTFATTVDKMKNHHFGTQNVPLVQCSWGSPTLFARSVF